MKIRALDLFAGTGWGVACKRLGIEEMGVELMAEAVATREANGMRTIYRDVWDGLTGVEAVPAYDLLIASPPCQTFSMAGNGAGRAALNEVLEAIDLEAFKRPEDLIAFGEKHDPRTALVLAPLAHVWRDRPQYVAFEQVPTVLPVWKACADVMRSWGYDVEGEVLNAEQYGVPQTRKRAILVANLDGPARLPTPTHSRYYSHDPSRLDPGVEKWVSMAEALGWKDERSLQGNQKPNGRDYQLRPDTSPAQTITAQANSFKLVSNYGTGGDPAARGERGADEPAATITSKADRNKWDGERNLTAEEAAALQSYPVAVKSMGSGMVERYGQRPGREADRPAFTIRASAGGTEPGGFRFQEETGTRKMTPDEAATLQAYEPQFEWVGTKSSTFLQIGNAVPPPLGQRIIEALTTTTKEGI